MTGGPDVETVGPPDEVRREAADLFVEVVDLRRRVAEVVARWRAVDGSLSDLAPDTEVGGGERLSERCGAELVVDLLADLGAEIERGIDGTGYPTWPYLVADLRQAWPATGWPLPEARP